MEGIKLGRDQVKVGVESGPGSSQGQGQVKVGVKSEVKSPIKSEVKWVSGQVQACVPYLPDPFVKNGSLAVNLLLLSIQKHHLIVNIR